MLGLFADRMLLSRALLKGALGRPLFSESGRCMTQRWMKVMSSIKKRCDACYIVRRGKIAYVYCKVHPRHKARQGPKNRQ